MKIINPYNLMILAGILWVWPLFATEGTKQFSFDLVCNNWVGNCLLLKKHR